MTNQTENTFKSQVDRHNPDEGTFEGKVHINNWAVTRRQRVLMAISFESKEHDIYDPQYSSDEGRKKSESRAQSVSSLYSDSSREEIPLPALIRDSNETQEMERSPSSFKSESASNSPALKLPLPSKEVRC